MFDHIIHEHPDDRARRIAASLASNPIFNRLNGAQRPMSELLPFLKDVTRAEKASAQAVSEAVENLDAVLFTGDLFFDAERVSQLENLLNRWRNQAVICRRIASDIAAGDGQ
jgi:CBS-domain-containing membrane protein